MMNHLLLLRILNRHDRLLHLLLYRGSQVAIMPVRWAQQLALCTKPDSRIAATLSLQASRTPRILSARLSRLAWKILQAHLLLCRQDQVIQS